MSIENCAWRVRALLLLAAYVFPRSVIDRSVFLSLLLITIAGKMFVFHPGIQRKRARWYVYSLYKAYRHSICCLWLE